MLSATPLLENQRHILTLRQLYAAKMQDLCTPEAHFGQGCEVHLPQGPCIRHDARIGRTNSVDIFDDFTAFGLQRRSHRNGRGVAAAPAERGDFPGRRVHALKSCQHHDAPTIKLLAHANGPYIHNACGGMGGVGHHAGLAAGEADRGHAEIGKRHAHQGHADALTGG